MRRKTSPTGQFGTTSSWTTSETGASGISAAPPPPAGIVIVNGGGSPGHIIGAVGSILRAAIVNLFVRQQITMVPTNWNMDGPARRDRTGRHRHPPTPSSTGPTHWPTPRRDCNTSKQDTHAARSSSPFVSGLPLVRPSWQERRYDQETDDAVRTAVMQRGWHQNRRSAQLCDGWDDTFPDHPLPSRRHSGTTGGQRRQLSTRFSTSSPPGFHSGFGSWVDASGMLCDLPFPSRYRSGSQRPVLQGHPKPRTA